MQRILSAIKFAMIAGLVFGLCFGIGMGGVKYFLADRLADKDVQNEEEIIDGDRINVLVMGMDARPGEDRTRTDTMMLASIDPELKKVALVSIPRDTKIDVPGSPLDKICTANLVGGPRMAVSKTEELLGESIDYYVLMDFKGFKKIVDTLGGVEIDVDQRMYKPAEGIDLRPGQQRLNGHDALAYVRYRGYVTADIERTAHQQQFIKALAKEVLKPKTITKLPSLIKQVDKVVDTNMGISDMLKLAKWIPAFKAESIASTTLPGYFYDVRDTNGTLIDSYWIADSSQNGKLLNSLMAGEEVAVVVNGPSGGGSQTQVVSQRNTNVSDGNSESSKSWHEELEDWERSMLPSPGHDTRSNLRS